MGLNTPNNILGGAPNGYQSHLTVSGNLSELDNLYKKSGGYDPNRKVSCGLTTRTIIKIERVKANTLPTINDDHSVAISFDNGQFMFVTIEFSRNFHIGQKFEEVWRSAGPEVSREK